MEKQERVPIYKRRWFILYVALPSLTLFALMFILNGEPSAPRVQTSTTPTMAYVISQTYVSMVLKSPSTADFPFGGQGELIGENTYRVEAYVDAQNGFGAMIRSPYDITLKYKGGDDADIANWEALEFVFNGEKVL